MAGQRLDRRHQGLAFIAPAVLGALAACAPPPPPPPGAIPLDQVVAARQLAGDWEWLHSETTDGTVVREHERWTFFPAGQPRRLAGFLRRDVLVRALDAVPFECNQRRRYHQRATLAVTAEITGDGIHIVERAYRAEPSPCDPGLRQLGEYTAVLDGDRLTLAWNGGTAVLRRAEPPPPAPAPPTPPAPAGRWRWDVTGWTRAGDIRHEDEDWELAVADDGTLAGTYVRAVTVRSPDGGPMPCAGGPAYAFVDRYLLRGRRIDDGWRIDEVAARAGEHPCLADTPRRTLDGATATLDGDYLVLSWRGKRRQVLARPLAP